MPGAKDQEAHCYVAANCNGTVFAVKRTQGLEAPVDSNGWYWIVMDSNGEVLGSSG